jgi:catalase
MDDPSIAEKLVEALARPDGCPKLRPVHAIGIGATGYFVASDVARQAEVVEALRRAKPTRSSPMN